MKTREDLLNDKVKQSARHLKSIIDEQSPTHIVSMVSGGKDSATSQAVLLECGINPDLIIHGHTGCGIEETTDFVKEHYGNGDLGGGADFCIADAGTAYEDYVLRKGFFGKGVDAHGFAYRVLKATPFRKAVSKYIRQRKRGVKVLLINGARKDESENRKKHLQRFRADPAQKGNVWFNIIHDWTQDDCNDYLESREICVNPVAKSLCRSGECMCGTMQSNAERLEAKLIYPKWGKWLDELEKEVREKHGWGWGENKPNQDKLNQLDLFQPMCKDCAKRGDK